MDDREIFRKQCAEEIERQGADAKLVAKSNEWLNAAASYKYSCHFEWLGVPIIQHPTDILVMQELIWRVKPDLIIECGVARGGSLIFNASMLELIWGGDENARGHIIGVDIDIRDHNRLSIENHWLSRRIKLVQGSSTEKSTVQKIYDLASGYNNVMVLLDSNHTHDHVYQELVKYSPLVSQDSYCVVFDTVVEDIDDVHYTDRPWGKGNSPRSAVFEFMRDNTDFIMDKEMQNKALITVARDGFLRRL